MSLEPTLPHGGVPPYVPPHLRGKVWDFRNEPDGTVTFQHPEAAVGFSPDQSRVQMTPEQYSLNFDPVERWNNYPRALREGHAPLDRHPKTGSRVWNDLIADKLSRAFNWGTSSQGKAVGTAGLLGAAAGGLGNYLWDRSQGEGGGSIGRVLTAALLTGALSAAGTAYAQNSHNKKEMWLSKAGAADGAVTQIIKTLQKDPTLSPSDLMAISSALKRAQRSDIDALHKLLSTAAGAGIGALVMRFLGARGLLPMLAGGLMGALFGSRDSEPKRNAFGQTSFDDL